MKAPPLLKTILIFLTCIEIQMTYVTYRACSFVCLVKVIGTDRLGFSVLLYSNVYYFFYVGIIYN